MEDSSKYSFATFFEIDKIYALSHRSQLERIADIAYVFDGHLSIISHSFPPHSINNWQIFTIEEQININELWALNAWRPPSP